MSPSAAALDQRTRWLLPADAYTGAAWFEREQRELFERTWNLVAYVSDLTDGRRVVASIGRERVVVSADDDGTITAVRHTRRPPAGAEPCAVGVWAGLVFAHLDPTRADAFATWLGAYPTPAWVGEFRWDDLVEIGRFRFPLACNWKLYIENHVDIYHLWFLHDDSLGMFDHAGLTWRADAAGHWSCAETPAPARSGPGPRSCASTASPTPRHRRCGPTCCGPTCR